MTPRPLYRWKSLWLGVLVLVFLAWAWVRSLSYVDGVSVAREDKMYEVGYENGVFIVSETQALMPGAFEARTFSHPYRPYPGQPQVKWALLYDEGFLRFRILVAFPVWLFMVLFSLPWLGFLAWRVRKERKLKS